MADWRLRFELKRFLEGTVARDGFGFYNAKSVFFAVNASLRWLNNVTSEYLVQVFLFFLFAFLQGEGRVKPGDCSNDVCFSSRLVINR
jgi:hypothetical protein